MRPRFADLMFRMAPMTDAPMRTLRARLPLRWLPGLAWLLALGLIALVAAELFWRWQAPAVVSAQASAPGDPRETARQLAALRPFGESAAAPTAAPAATPAATRYRVNGIATGFGRAAGFALIQIDGGEARPYVVGDSLGPGVRLAALQAESVELDQGGRRLMLPLQRDAEAPVPPVSPSRPGASPSRAAP